MKYDKAFFQKQLLHLLNISYEQYKNYTEFDILIDFLHSEAIYEYYEVDWSAFASKLVNDDIISRVPLFYNVKQDDRLELISNKFTSREIKIKLLLFFQKNVDIIWKNWGGTEFIVKECARLISQNIHESVRDAYHGEYVHMPKIDLRRWLQYPNIFNEITPTGLFEENIVSIKNNPLIIKDLYKKYTKYLFPQEVVRYGLYSSSNSESKSEKEGDDNTMFDSSKELQLLQQRHKDLHAAFAELQKKESGHSAIIKAQEKMILELQEENKELKEDNFYLNKELSLALQGKPLEQVPILSSNESQNKKDTHTQIIFKYIESDDTNIIEEIEYELEQLMTGNNAAKVCDTLMEYQKYMNCPRKLPESIYDALQQRWPNLGFSKETFCQAWKRKQKKSN